MAEDRPSGEGTGSRGWNEAQRAAVIEEMNLILAHPIFKTSNRCIDLLRYVIDHALAGQEDEIKERTLGIEVFGRSANYDLSTDPIVRRVASEIRKRLAQYYQEGDSNQRVRIYMDRGSYLPTFKFALDRNSQEFVDAQDTEELLEPPQQQSPAATQLEKAPLSTTRFLRLSWILGIAAVVLALVAIYQPIRLNVFHTPEYRVWKPLIESSSSITVCLPDDTPLASDGQKTGSPAAFKQGAPSQTTSPAMPHDGAPSALFRDARVSNNISTLLTNYKIQTDLRASSSLKFWDFHQKPTVLIGGLNNPWVPLLLSKLRFSVQLDTVTGQRWIQDAQNPSKRDWQIAGNLPSDPSNDYAIVTRIFDGETGEWILALSGLEGWGTEAAADLVADPKLAKLIPSNVRDQGNFQIVLKTSVIGGEAGPLQILAVQTW